MKYKYLSLSIGARNRLAILRRDFEQWFVKNPHAPRDRVKSWRDVRFATFKSETGLDQGSNDGKPIWYTQSGQFFRREFWCDDVRDACIGHTGWYADSHQESKVRGIVARLPHNRWLAGYWTSDNDERVYFPTIYDDWADAARAADSEAESIADKEREHNEQWEEAREIENKISDLKDRIAELFALRNHPKLGKVSREELEEKLAEVREKSEKLATDYKDVL